MSEDSDDYEPMFGFGMFDEPSPDTTEILERDDYSMMIHPLRQRIIQIIMPAHTRVPDLHIKIARKILTEVENTENSQLKVLKGDVKNYLRLGNAAWLEKRLERAAEHFRKATEIDPEEPRAWHNLAVCNYHLALKRNPDDVEGAVASAYEPLKVAKEKGGNEYTSVDKTLAFLASQIGIEE